MKKHLRRLGYKVIQDEFGPNGEVRFRFLTEKGWKSLAVMLTNNSEGLSQIVNPDWDAFVEAVGKPATIDALQQAHEEPDEDTEYRKKCAGHAGEGAVAHLIQSMSLTPDEQSASGAEVTRRARGPVPRPEYLGLLPETERANVYTVPHLAQYRFFVTGFCARGCGMYLRFHAIGDPACEARGRERFDRAPRGAVLVYVLEEVGNRLVAGERLYPDDFASAGDGYVAIPTYWDEAARQVFVGLREEEAPAASRDLTEGDRASAPADGDPTEALPVTEATDSNGHMGSEAPSAVSAEPTSRMVLLKGGRSGGRHRRRPSWKSRPGSARPALEVVRNRR
jgi:hypothetical protein